jgi:hypothetical protein
MLIQSRASRISDVLKLKDVDEIASSPPGAVQDAVSRKIREEIREIEAGTSAPPKAPIEHRGEAAGATVRYATMRDGKAEFDTS